MTKRAAIYVRASSDEQTNGYSISTQLEACRKYAQEHGYVVTREFSEDHTGTELDRPALTKLRKLLQDGGAGVMIVYDIDRLTRNAQSQMHLERELAELGVQIEYVLR